MSTECCICNQIQIQHQADWWLFVRLKQVWFKYRHRTHLAVNGYIFSVLGLQVNCRCVQIEAYPMAMMCFGWKWWRRLMNLHRVGALRAPCCWTNLSMLLESRFGSQTMRGLVIVQDHWRSRIRSQELQQDSQNGKPVTAETGHRGPKTSSYPLATFLLLLWSLENHSHNNYDICEVYVWDEHATLAQKILKADYSFYSDHFTGLHSVG